MLATLLLVVKLGAATLSSGAGEVPVIVGKSATPTPIGTYELKRAYSTKLKMKVFIFKQDGTGIYAIHPNLPSRKQRLRSGTPDERALSAGCIGIDRKHFDILWIVENPLTLEVVP